MFIMRHAQQITQSSHTHQAAKDAGFEIDSDTKTITFLTLPAEIRLMIYEHALPDKRVIVREPGRKRAVSRVPGNVNDEWYRRRPMPRLLSVCKRIRSDALPGFMHRQCFVFRQRIGPGCLYPVSDLGKKLSLWLQTFGEGVKFLRKIAFHIGESHACWRMHLKLIRGCGPLKAKAWVESTTVEEVRDTVDCIKGVMEETGFRCPEFEIFAHDGKLPEIIYYGF